MTDETDSTGQVVSEKRTNSVLPNGFRVESETVGTADSDPDRTTDPQTVAVRLREYGEYVRRRELDTALDRLAANGDLNPEQRAALVRLSTRISDALVDGWVARLVADEVDEATVLELFGGR